VELLIVIVVIGILAAISRLTTRMPSHPICLSASRTASAKA